MCINEKRKVDALKVSDHVAYEIKMFLYCIIKITEHEKKKQKSEHDKNLHYAIVESFALHFRNLYSYYKQNYKKNDPKNIYYSDIYESAFSEIEEFYDEYKLACKKIMHIDRNRESKKVIEWEYIKIYEAFKSPIKSFIEDSTITDYITEKHRIREIKEYIKNIDNIKKTPGLPAVTNTCSKSESIISKII